VRDCEVDSGVWIVTRGERVAEQLHGALELAFADGDCAEPSERNGNDGAILFARAFEVASELEGRGSTQMARKFIVGKPRWPIGSSGLGRSYR
jgi:hypothetical protein